MGTFGAAMNLIWPCFYDSEYRPTQLERLVIHWKANLRMLRFPRDIGLFTVISLIPMICLLWFAEWFPGLFGSGPATPGAPLTELQTLAPVLLLIAVGFLALQHLAFVRGDESDLRSPCPSGASRTRRSGLRTLRPAPLPRSA